MKSFLERLEHGKCKGGLAQADHDVVVLDSSFAVVDKILRTCKHRSYTPNRQHKRGMKDVLNTKILVGMSLVDEDLKKSKCPKKTVIPDPFEPKSGVY